MDKEQLLQAIFHNAKATIQFGKDSGDAELEAIGHATLIALTALQNGHLDELSMLLGAFVAFKVETSIEEEKQNCENELQEILKSAGIETEN